MTLEFKRAQPDDVLAATKIAQGKASDPESSAWVDANAGTGKTYVLTLRVLRLLLSGTRPEKILCLTFTKAAAAEMSKRVFDRLAGWVTMDAEELGSNLAEITGERASLELIDRSRKLFAQAIETPGGLKVQTIHAFSERLLQRFPLEADVAPNFKTLDDAPARELKALAIDETLKLATSQPSSSLGKSLDIIIRYAAEDRFDQLISKAVEERRWLEALVGAEPKVLLDELKAMDVDLRRRLDIRAGVAADDVHSECANILPADVLRELSALLKSSGSANDAKAAAKLDAALLHSDHRHVGDELAGYFLTEKLEIRKDLMTSGLSRANANLNDRCKDAQKRFLKLREELRALAVVEASLALYEISSNVLVRYAAARRSAGALDFNDLILKTRDLLASENGQAQWVLFKLDDGLDHILVDEAQDTSPTQWEIISALAQEFFSDVGARSVARTIFAVGDEKQSIYSFQGAVPERFAEMGKRFAELTQEAGRGMERVPLTLSFRTVSPILRAVDRVFADPSSTPGVSARDGDVEHVASRVGQAGLVEIWDTEKFDDAAPGDPWDPLSDGKEQSPANRLAEKIADTIRKWLDSGELLPSENRKITPGDILILVRKRNPFAVPMVAALKRRNIPVAGSDRLKLIEQIAIQDLMVLGDFLTLPEDDLALATILKSPFFDLDDDDLLELAHGRKATLWKALLDKTQKRDAPRKYQDAAAMLKRWRAKADFVPPFEFYSALLDRDGMREKMLSRLGPEAADVLDEFLAFALSYDEHDPPSLTSFLSKLRAVNPEVKRDMDHGRDEVRVMTVHGAKGLEAPIVVLPDTCTTASGDNLASRLVTLAAPSQTIVWPVKGTSQLPLISAARAANEQRDREERNRLLYVAMTRARDRLYVTGFENKKGRAQGCWYDAISQALLPTMLEITLADGQTIWRMETPQTAEPRKPDSEKAGADAAIKPPDFAFQRAPAEPRLSVPLAPSRLEPYAPDAEGEPLLRPRPDPAATSDSPSPLAGGSATRFLRGTITHALLQHLPAIAEGDREALASAFVDRRGAALPAHVRRNIVIETLAVLSDARFGAIFGTQSIAEAPVAAVIPRPSGQGPALNLSGQLDRLAITDDAVLIVDYKTNRPPPAEVTSVSDAYLYQLAAYRLALAEVYPGKTIRAALLWTDGPRLMEIPDSVLDSYTSRLWDLNEANLDAN
jgi:ATP-dependent helicase/nuclease subunit A